MSLSNSDSEYNSASETESSDSETEIISIDSLKINIY